MSNHLASALSALLLCATTAAAATHYVQAPGAPAVEGISDGSDQAPWPSLDVALSSGSVAPGDEVRLAPGEYGDVMIAGALFPALILIRPDQPGTVHATSLQVNQSSNLVIEGLLVWPEGPNPNTLIHVRADAAAIIFRGLDVRSVEDAATYPMWSLRDWEARRHDGVLLNGPDNALLDSQLTGLYFAIAATGPRARVAGNLVLGFSGDGMRGLGDGSVFEGNRVQDCVQIDDNHADAFQSWSRGPNGRPGEGTVEGLVLRQNTLVEWAQPIDNPLRCDLQGIGLFDGMFRNLVIENNLIVVSAYHGIAVTGGLGVTIIHNTLVNPRQPGADRPWLSVTPHKDGQLSADVTVANNLAPQFRFLEIDPAGMFEASNVVSPYPAQVLVAPYAGRFDPRPGGALVDAGDLQHTSSFDILGHPRDARPDIGAFEVP